MLHHVIFHLPIYVWHIANLCHHIPGWQNMAGGPGLPGIPGIHH